MAFEQLESLFVTDIGRVRDNNEDAVLALPGHGIFGVADGMGGAEGGEEASRIVMDNITAAFSNALRSQPSTLDANIEALRHAVDRADKEIKTWADNHGTSGTGTTLVALVFDPQCSFFGSVLHAGDSRAYQYRNGTLTRLSTDHSMATALGLEDEARLPSSFQGVITHAIGTQDGKGLEENTFDVEEGDLYLLCSDGLTRLLNDDKIAAIIREHENEDLQKMSSQLVEKANASGGVDNISAGLIRVKTDRPAEIRPKEIEPLTDKPEPILRRGDISPVDEAARRFLARRDTASAPRQSSLSLDSDRQATTSEEPEPRTVPERPAALAMPAIKPESPPTRSEKQKPEPEPVDSNDRNIPEPAPDLPTSRKKIWISILLPVAVIAAAFCLNHMFRSGGQSDPASKLLPDEATRADLPRDDSLGEPVTDADVARTRRLIQEALKTGQWGALRLHFMEDAQRNRAILEEADPEAIYGSWLYLWEKICYTESPETTHSDYTSYCELMGAIQNTLNNETPLEFQDAWPASPELQADFVCRESYRQQEILLENMTLEIGKFNDRLSVFQGDRAAVLNDLCLMGPEEPGRAERMGVAIVEAERQILALHKWIGANRSSPRDPESLGKTISSSLPAISNSIRIVGELLRQNLLALSAESIRDYCGEKSVASREVDNILIMRDRLVQPEAEIAATDGEPESTSEWFTDVKVEQVRFFLQRLTLTRQAD